MKVKRVRLLFRRRYAARSGLPWLVITLRLGWTGTDSMSCLL